MNGEKSSICRDLHYWNIYYWSKVLKKVYYISSFHGRYNLKRPKKESSSKFRRWWLDIETYISSLTWTLQLRCRQPKRFDALLLLLVWIKYITKTPFQKKKNGGENAAPWTPFDKREKKMVAKLFTSICIHQYMMTSY